MALTDEIFDMNRDDRMAEFEYHVYFLKFGRLAHTEREAARKKAIKKIEKDKNLLEEFAREYYRKGLEKGAQTGAGTAMQYGLNAYVAKEVVKGTVKGGVDHLGRRGAVVAIEQSAGMAASQGAHAAANGMKVAGKMGSFLPGISAAIGQSIGEYVSDQAGITNHHAKNCMSAGGAMAGGATAGAFVGGPVGAAAGAAIGAASWGVGKGIDALVTSGLGVKGPNDNWAYITTGCLNYKVCFSTYGPNDTLYWKSYWNEYKGSNCGMFVMSSGQGQDQHFQITVYDNNNTTIKHFDQVFFRDFVHVGKNRRGHVCVAFGKGENWGNAAGTVDIY